MEISTLLQAIKQWGRDNNNVDSILLIGSHARGKARPDSDIDIVIICNNPTELLKNPEWISLFGEVIKYSIEDWGMVQSIRTFYNNGWEIEFGITSPKWVALPADTGTKKVIAGGANIILDKDGVLKSLLKAIKND